MLKHYLIAWRCAPGREQQFPVGSDIKASDVLNVVYGVAMCVQNIQSIEFLAPFLE